MIKKADLAAEPCPGCGEPISANYCAACGEQRFDRSRHTVQHFFAELTRFFTDLDNRFLRSVGLLIARPGFLTREVIKGRRKQYLSPIALFAVANLVFFFTQPLANINTFNSTLEMQQRDYLHSPLVQERVETYLASGQLSAAEFATKYDGLSEDIAKSLIILQVPILALLLTLIRVRSGSLMFDHLIWSTHFYAFQLLLNAAITVGVFVYFKTGGNDFSLGIPVLLITLLYIFFAMRKAFDDRIWVAGLRSIAALFAFGLVIEIYRSMLFLITFAFATV